MNNDRRRLLAGLAAVAAAPLAAAAPRLRSGGDKRRFGIAIAGLGGYGRYALGHLANAKLAYPAALISRSPESARELAALHGIPEDAIYGYDDADRIAADARIDAVHLCLPVGLHSPHAMRAFAAGKHVLCEKPLAGTVDEARAMIAAADAARRVLMPAYRAWFSQAVQDVRRRAREATHGVLVSIDTHKGFSMAQPEGNWRFDPALSGGGCLPDIGIYSVQLQRWIAGGVPRRVSAQLHSADDPRFARVESDVSWLAEFDGGVLATGSASWRYRLQNRMRVGFANAWVDLDPATPAIGERMRIGLDAPSRIEEPAFPLAEQVVRMYDAFAETCLGRTAVPVPASEGVDDLRMMDAILRAARTAQAVELLP